MVNKLDDALRFHQTALSLRAARQELLAGNIANADTPNYKARDIDFASALQNALGGNATQSPITQLPIAQTSSLHLGGNGAMQNTLPDTILGAPLQYRKPVQPSADGNTVDVDVERVQFADNALRYEAGVTFVNAQLKGILSAIQG